MAYKKKEINPIGSTVYQGADGKSYTLNLGNIQSDVYEGTDGSTVYSLGGDGYRTNNLFSQGGEHLDGAIQYLLEYGKMPTKEELEYYTGYKINDNAWNNIRYDLNVFTSQNNLDLNTYKQNANISDPNQEAFNEYYNDIYSLEEGTTGRQMLDNYTLAEQNAAMSNMQLAEAQYQQAAMQQAETVKSIADQVRAERMSRLRAGMSEADIANQDMQTMLNNMNTLNQQMGTMNQNRLAAQQQYNLAQDTAYQQYIESAVAIGNTEAAMYAASAGDPNYIAQQYAKNVNKLYSPKQYSKIQGAQ